MKIFNCTLDSVYLGTCDDDLGKEVRRSLNAQLSGFVGDRHGAHARAAWAKDDKQTEGTMRRNERQWSAVSREELARIAVAMKLDKPLSAASLGANLCLSGIDNFSHLPKGTILRFPSGAELIVEEYNPPCVDMDEKLVAMHTSKDDLEVSQGSFLAAAKYSRGLVGVIEVPGIIHAGDKVVVIPYRNPAWLGKTR